MRNRNHLSRAVERLERRDLLTTTVFEVEPNDVRPAATPFEISDQGAALAGTSQSDDDKDFYVFTPTQSGTLHIDVSSSNGNFAQLEIENALGDSIFETEPNDGSNAGSVEVSAGERLFVRLRSKTDRPAEYSAQLSLDADPGTDPGDPGTDPADADTDIFPEVEANDRQSQANPFALGDNGLATLTGISQSDDDKDFFVFTPTESGTLHINVSSSNGNFAQLEIENAFGDSIFETEPNDGINVGSINLVEGQSLFVRLRSKTSQPAEYSAELSLRNVGPAIAGDTDGDGDVDIDDFNTLRNNFGSSGDLSRGDFTGDAMVNVDDFAVLANSFGEGTDLPTNQFELSASQLSNGIPVSPIYGDFDGDLDVDSSDRTAQTIGWTGARDSESIPPTHADAAFGDIDGDGDVDSVDALLLTLNWTGARS